MVTARAKELSTRSIKQHSKIAGLRLALSMVDLTTLEGADSPERVRALCRKAMRPWAGAIGQASTDDDDGIATELAASLPSCAAVCVYPNLVEVARRTLSRSSGVKIAAVATGFPSGQFPLSVRLDDVRRAIDAGADEIDMVINRGAYLRGDHQMVINEIAAVQSVCCTYRAPGDVRGSAPPVHLKIILETGELGSFDAIRRASDLAIHAAMTTHAHTSGGDAWEDGAIFIKTSTGKVKPAATLPVTLIMLEAIRDAYDRTGKRIGMKPAGGIRTAKDALRYLTMVKEVLGREWLSPSLFRFGASSLANDLVRQLIKQTHGAYAAPYDTTRA